MLDVTNTTASKLARAIKDNGITFGYPNLFWKHARHNYELAMSEYLTPDYIDDHFQNEFDDINDASDIEKRAYLDGNKAEALEDYLTGKTAAQYFVASSMGMKLGKLEVFGTDKDVLNDTPSKAVTEQSIEALSALLESYDLGMQTLRAGAAVFWFESPEGFAGNADEFAFAVVLDRDVDVVHVQILAVMQQDGVVTGCLIDLGTLDKTWAEQLIEDFKDERPLAKTNLQRIEEVLDNRALRMGQLASTMIFSKMTQERFSRMGDSLPPEVTSSFIPFMGKVRFTSKGGFMNA